MGRRCFSNQSLTVGSLYYIKAASAQDSRASVTNAVDENESVAAVFLNSGFCPIFAVTLSSRHKERIPVTTRTELKHIP